MSSQINKRKNSISALVKIFSLLTIQPNFLSEPVSIADSPPPWKRNLLQINMDLAEFKKKNTSDEIFQMLHQEMLENANTDHIFYTDGSHKDDISSYAVVKWEQHSQTHKVWQGLLPKEAGSYIAELAAINKAISIARSYPGRSVILTDNLGILKGLRNVCNRCPTLEQLRRTLTENVILAWVPGHTGIKGNETADVAAKNAIKYPLIIEVPNIYQLTRQTYLQQQTMELENNWNNCNTFLRTHNPHHLRIPYNTQFTREDCIKVLRIRVGKTIFTPNIYIIMNFQKCANAVKKFFQFITYLSNVPCHAR